MRHIRWKARLILWVVHGSLRHEAIPIHLGLLGASWRHNLRDHVWSHAPDIAPGLRARVDTWLRSVAPRNRVTGMRSKDAILDGRRCRWGVMPHVRELRLALEMRRQHVRVYALPLRRSAASFITSLLISAAIEIGGAFMFVWASMLHDLVLVPMQRRWIEGCWGVEVRT